MQTAFFETSWGWCGAGFSSRGLTLLQLPVASRGRAQAAWRERTASVVSAPREERNRDSLDSLAQEVEGEVRAYFEGRCVRFNLPIDWSIATGFRRAVLEQTRKIPFGKTVSYGGLSRFVRGDAKAARAVGGALAANPIPLVLPCHRVVGSRGEMMGFSAEGGADFKKRLIEFEAQVLARGAGANP